MLDPRYLSDNPQEAEAQLSRRGPRATAELPQVLELGARRRQTLMETEALKQQLNAANDAMQKAAKGPKGPEFEARRAELRAISDRAKAGDEQLREIEAQLEDLALRLPNLPAADTPDGPDASGNVVVRSWGEKPSIASPKAHWEIGEALGILDFERAAKITGARFTVLQKEAARLERALMMFMLDRHQERGYTEVFPPFMVNRASMTGTGQLPKFEEDSFKVAGTDYFLVPTAEVPVTNLHSGEILDEAQLPIRYSAYTACFRAEAGAAGKDTRGLIRQHQFDKVELVKICRPEESPAEHEALTADAEGILQALGLHYQVVQLCAGDLGWGAQKCYDLEVWLPGQDAYREISSCSNYGDYQARRAKIRYRPGAAGAASGGKASKEKPRFCHTINGSGLAIGRTLVAILENYQQPDGSVVIPPVLRPYMGGLERISRG
jgi:seryl-tRNA synthetase